MPRKFETLERSPLYKKRARPRFKSPPKRKKGAFDREKFDRFRALPAGPERLRLRNELIAENIPFVAFKARQFLRNWDNIELDELIDVGALTLAGVLERFDPTRGSFAGYAALFLRGAFLEYTTSVLDISIPRRFRLPAKAYALADVRATKENRIATFADVQEAARELGSPKSVVETAGQVIFSFEGVWNEFTDSFEERNAIPPSTTDTAEEYENAERLATLDAALLSLSDDARRVVKKHYYEELPLSENETDILRKALSEMRGHF